MKKRFIPPLLLGLALTFAACEKDRPTLSTTASQAGSQQVVVYKSEHCGCCGKWVSHLEDGGFSVETQNVTNLTEIKKMRGVPANLSSCHTAEVAGYIVEGHVPGHVVQRMLEEKPDIKGIAVAGMPIGSPGMEGHNARPYDVIAFNADGTTRVFATITP